MKPLTFVLTFKLVVTAVVWAGPLLLFPACWLAAAGLPLAAVPLARLLGCAYVALGVGYWLGLRELRAGRRPMSAIATGILSNGGAAAYLTYFGVTGGLAAWHPAVRAAAWVFAAMTAAIALGLYWFGLRDGAASEPARS